MTLFPDTMETMLTTMKIHEHSYLGLFLNCGALSRLTPPRLFRQGVSHFVEKPKQRQLGGTKPLELCFNHLPAILLTSDETVTRV